MTSQETASNRSAFGMRYGITPGALMWQGSNGREYIFATELPAGPAAAFGINRAAIMLQWVVALLVSGSICYLPHPASHHSDSRLRQASQKLAGGDLRTRATAAIERHDELGDLVRDFNAMAARIEELVSRQRQLIPDVSHELRSPPGSTERKGNDPAFDHMEKAIGLLDDMIGRLLTIARLDTSTPPVPMVLVDLTALVSQIVSKATFESHERNSGVSLTAHGQLLVQEMQSYCKCHRESGPQCNPLYRTQHVSRRLAADRAQIERIACRPRLSVIVGQAFPNPNLPTSSDRYRVADARDRTLNER